MVSPRPPGWGAWDTTTPIDLVNGEPTIGRTATMQHRDWAAATELRPQLYDPQHSEHPQLDQPDQYLDEAMNVRRWALVLGYGDGALIVEGDPNDIASVLDRTGELVHAATNTTSRFTLGYQAAKRFYGPDTRAALDLIAAEIAALRADFPRLPFLVGPRIARIEQLASRPDGTQPNESGGP